MGSELEEALYKQVRSIAATATNACSVAKSVSSFVNMDSEKQNLIDCVKNVIFGASNLVNVVKAYGPKLNREDIIGQNQILTASRNLVIKVIRLLTVYRIVSKLSLNNSPMDELSSIVRQVELEVKDLVDKVFIASNFKSGYGVILKGLNQLIKNIITLSPCLVYREGGKLWNAVKVLEQTSQILVDCAIVTATKGHDKEAKNTYLKNLANEINDTTEQFMQHVKDVSEMSAVYISQLEASAYVLQQKLKNVARTATQAALQSYAASSAAATSELTKSLKLVPQPDAITKAAQECISGVIGVLTRYKEAIGDPLNDSLQLQLLSSIQLTTPNIETLIDLAKGNVAGVSEAPVQEAIILSYSHCEYQIRGLKNAAKDVEDINEMSAEFEWYAPNVPNPKPAITPITSNPIISTAIPAQVPTPSSSNIKIPDTSIRRPSTNISNPSTVAKPTPITTPVVLPVTPTGPMIPKPATGITADSSISLLNLKGGYERENTKSECYIAYEVEECSYRDRFSANEHQNYIGVDPSLGVFLFCYIKEKDGYRLLIKSIEGTKRHEFSKDLKSSRRMTSLFAKGDAFGTSKNQILLLLQDLYPTMNPKTLQLVKDPALKNELISMEERMIVTNFKFGVLYVKAGQVIEEDMFGNEHGSPEFDEFMGTIANKIDLKGFKGFRGGLDVKHDTTGKHSYYTKVPWNGYDIELMFHVCTELPYVANDSQQLQRKRHIGNDIVVLVYKEGDVPFNPSVLVSHFNHVFVVVQKDLKTADTYRVEVAWKEGGIRQFKPPTPATNLVNKKDLSDYLLKKLINGEAAAWEAPEFQTKLRRTREMILKNFLNDYGGQT